MPANTALTPKQENLPDFLKDIAPLGNEDAGTVLQIPFMKLLSSLAPELKKKVGGQANPKFIEGAEEGNFINSSTNEIYGDSVDVICCYTKSQFKVWKKFETGGGFEGNFLTNAEALAYVQAHETSEDLEIQETDDHALLINNKPVVFSCARSKLWPSRTWSTAIVKTGLCRWAKVWKLSSVSLTSRKSGAEYITFSASDTGKFVDEATAERGEKLYEEQTDSKLLETPA